MDLLGSLLPFAESLPAVRAVLGFVLVFLLPGFAWSLVFFSRVNLIERLALSVGLSIATVTLSVIVFNVLFGMRIGGDSSLLTIIVITIIAFAAYWLKRRLISRETDTGGD